MFCSLFPKFKVSNSKIINVFSLQPVCEYSGHIRIVCSICINAFFTNLNTESYSTESKDFLPYRTYSDFEAHVSEAQHLMLG